MVGYIKLFRSITQWLWYTDFQVCHLFIHLILTANFYDSEWQEITILRGQLVTSRLRLAKETGLSEKVVRRCLKSLEKTGEIFVEPTNKYSIITIRHYADYQGDVLKSGQQRANRGP